MTRENSVSFGEEIANSISHGIGLLLAIAMVPVLIVTAMRIGRLAGGIAYTSGLLFFAAKRLRYAHFIWHLFVVAGTTCHFFAVLWYAAE